jgi:AcrR family transcriptional regulator
MLATAIDIVRETGSVPAIEECALRCGIARSAAYKLFDNNTDLDAQVRQQIVEALMSSLGPVMNPQGTVGDAITNGVNAYLGWISSNLPLYRLITNESLSNAERSHDIKGSRIAIARQFSELLHAAMLNSGSDAEFSEPFAFGIVAFADTIVNRWFALHPEFSGGEDLTVVADFLGATAWDLVHRFFTRAGVPITLDTPLLPLINKQTDE